MRFYFTDINCFESFNQKLSMTMTDIWSDFLGRWLIGNTRNQGNSEECSTKHHTEQDTAKDAQAGDGTTTSRRTRRSNREKKSTTPDVSSSKYNLRERRAGADPLGSKCCPGCNCVH